MVKNSKLESSLKSRHPGRDLVEGRISRSQLFQGTTTGEFHQITPRCLAHHPRLESDKPHGAIDFIGRSPLPIPRQRGLSRGKPRTDLPPDLWWKGANGHPPVRW